MRRFGQGLTELEQRRRRAGRVGMQKAALALLLDSVDEQPKAPHNYGTLRASGSVFVDDKHVLSHQAQVDEGGADPAPLTELTTPERRLSEIRGTVTFNQPCAANLHAGVRYDRKTHGLVPIQEWGMTRANERDLEPAEGTGADFVGAKIKRFGRRYLSVVAKSMKSGMRRGTA